MAAAVLGREVHDWSVSGLDTVFVAADKDMQECLVLQPPGLLANRACLYLPGNGACRPGDEDSEFRSSSDSSFVRPSGSCNGLCSSLVPSSCLPLARIRLCAAI